MKAGVIPPAVDHFEPVTLAITIESKVELAEMWLRLNIQRAELILVNQRANTDTTRSKAFAIVKVVGDGHSCVPLWEQLDDLMDKYHV